VQVITVSAADRMGQAPPAGRVGGSVHLP
jgi:hypothetical protein